jgi:chromosome segregation ATPase
MKRNAVTAILLFVAIRENWPPETLADCLDARLWQVALEEADVRSRRVLLVDPSLAALGLATRLLQKRIGEQVERLDSLSREEQEASLARDEALARETSLLAAKEQLDEQLERQEKEVAALRSELADEKEQRRIDRSHGIDGYETLRTRTVRQITQQLELLETGLHALRDRRDNVTDEYLERVIAALNSDLEQLRTSESPLGGTPER